ncbi:Molybdopterin-synthase adenylyltransferase [Candidatus Competibacter denitrificans Run_A_D11]|uniref:Molybdopterin-synthase adenylyltransferase n=1 Tax=Candidatus Competibacter denitrificans Run_A_D11 TaxID=1400863 RepID=W6M335_9GAMM|nr:molybdopterin-synthase adenylyltransferase MoeB [Candidatus Competibacter denitrificans]CDI01986.1 Molybdopterin-synthase adenylyltransferase [Candidatus Competibacter denitrificans Run_A_D11]HAS86335.1 molybdopterin-synthase adenylyltransferase MoeB [Candidatus Competibacteraceae bacterium]HRC70158.1 molybdopterin-synthase adenylyltransferase MoeB [Candidatus Competibacter denitrificans]
MTDDELLRYSRQILLPDFDIEGQKRLRQSHALIIGLGGLGSVAAMYLAAAGVGRLTLVDFDKVDLSNLQRQIIHRTADIGRLKVESARDGLLRLNPTIEIETVPAALTETALREQVALADVVVDSCDNLPTRLAINAACVGARVPLVSGAAIRMEGQVLVWQPHAQGACYRCLYRDSATSTETCAQTGVLAPVVGVIGSIQALEVIKMLVGCGETLAGRLLLLDAARMEWRTLKVQRNPACSVCGSARPCSQNC